jgi:hypothetical protein
MTQVSFAFDYINFEALLLEKFKGRTCQPLQKIQAYPLIAPIMTPLTKYFCSKG